MLAQLAILVILTVYEWRYLQSHGRKKRTYFIVLSTLGAVFLFYSLSAFFPKAIDPSRWIYRIFRPIEDAMTIWSTEER